MTDEVIDMIYQSVDRSLNQYNELRPATSVIGKNQTIMDPWRNCSDASISSYNWFAGMIWHHISRANNLNFGYDLTCFDNDHINFIRYQPTQYYHWHTDDIWAQADTIPNQTIFKSNPVKTIYRRKLSFTLFLNDNYTGGEFQIMPGPKSMCQVTPKKGTLVVFDSRAWHRVRKVKSGTRDVLVGWAIGPTWK
jgi:hypothetical protein